MTIFFNPACGSCTCTASNVKRVYVGGYFTDIAGTAKTRIAMLDVNGAVVTAFGATLNDNPECMYFDEAQGRLWVGGYFTTVNGAACSGLVCLDSTTGATVFAYTLAYTISPTIPVILNCKASGNYLYVAGIFTQLSGNTRSGFARVNITTGAVDAWNPVREVGSAWGVGITPTGTGTVYLGYGNAGSSQTMNGSLRSGCAAVDDVTGTTTLAWAPDTFLGGVHDILVHGTTTFITGIFQKVNTTGTLTTRFGLAEVDATTGVVTSWDPGNPILNGPSGRRLATLDALGFLCSGPFVNAGAGAVGGPVVSFLYAGAIDTGFAPGSLGSTADDVRLGPDNRVWAACGGVPGGLFRMNASTGLIDASWAPGFGSDGTSKRCVCFQLSETPP